jgi:sortase (surface protein transpeptidase)
LRLAAPLALLALGLLVLAVGLAIGGLGQGNDSWTQGSWEPGTIGFHANIPGWPQDGPSVTVGTQLSTTTSVSMPDNTTASLPTTVSSTFSSPNVHAIEDPARVSIPSLSIDAKLISVGIEKNGYMQVPPFGLAAWYKLGPSPGAPGPAVIVGHVDSKKGRDVFFRLKDVKVGETVLVYDKSGAVATFVVDGKEQQLKTALPVDRIWSNTKAAVLRLITCGGRFDRTTGHYLSNVIVYAHLAA